MFRSLSFESMHFRSFHRAPISALIAALGAGLFFAMAVQIEGDVAGPLEIDLFRALNDLPKVIATILWVPMQFGNFLVIPAVAVGAAIYKRWRLAGALAIAGVGKYVGARLVKGEFERHRPAVFLEDVNLGMGSSDSGLGFVSGHAVVAVALAVVLYPYLRSSWARALVIAAAAVVCIGRVQVGAHLPMDVIGGAGVGMIIGGLANLVVGVPRRVELERSMVAPIPREA